MFRKTAIALATASFARGAFAVEPAFAAVENHPARSAHRHVAPYRHPQTVEDMSRSQFDRHYWRPCDSGFRAYIVNGCD